MGNKNIKLNDERARLLGDKKDVKVDGIEWRDVHECKYCCDERLKYMGIKKSDFKKYRIKCAEYKFKTS